MKPLTVGSLFSGIGGFDLGFERAGMEIRWQVEIDKQARSVSRRHWPNVTQYEDVRNVGRANLEPVDVICGGFPCQDLSVAGRRAGLAGRRSGLFWELCRVVEELRPRWVVLENVPGLLSSCGCDECCAARRILRVHAWKRKRKAEKPGKCPICLALEGMLRSHRGRDLAAVLGGLADLGYGWAFRIVDAQYFGLAQRRKRVFIVASPGNGTGPAQVLFEPDSVSWDSPPRRETGKEVAGSLGGGSGIRGWASDTDRMTFVPTVSPAIKARDHKGPSSDGDGDGDGDGAPLVAHSLRAEGFDASEDGTGRGTPIVPVCIKGAAIGRKPEAGPQYGETLEDGSCYTLNCTEQHAVAFQCHGTNVGEMGTLRQGNGAVTGGVPFLGSGFGVRRLTPRECERLQGFPPDWTRYADNGRELADGPRYRMLGNAVAVPCAEWIGRRIAAADHIGDGNEMIQRRPT